MHIYRISKYINDQNMLLLKILSNRGIIEKGKWSINEYKNKLVELIMVQDVKILHDFLGKCGSGTICTFLL